MPRQNRHQPTLPCIHWPHLHTLADGDEHFALALLSSFLADGDRQIAELRQVIAEGDYQKAHHHTHQIKGSSANVGALQVEAIVTRLDLYLQSHGASSASRCDVPEPDLLVSSSNSSDSNPSASSEMSSDEYVANHLTELEKAIAQIRSTVAERLAEVDSPQSRKHDPKERHIIGE